ncbi:MAG: NUDIX hydrolase [Burkholderiales bacterium]|nr:NUDIX hydrolase [Burkholderiales bacterium]OJX09157.1 MAG: NUDIX hydrolase [Burkholderiales bacterium 70-64]
MKFCSVCGHEVQLSVPPGDNRPRYRCAHCGTIHYQNPTMVLGTIPVWEDKVLLCRRAIEPRYGFWTLPAGFMENGETTAEGAQRETMEEAGARIALGEAFSMVDVPHVNQVHVFFRAELLDIAFAPGPESLETRLFTEAEVPWDAMAFRTVAQTLRWFFEDRRSGVYSMHTGAIRSPVPRPA